MSDNETNPDLNKFEIDNPELKYLMMEVASRIQAVLPASMRFSLFLYEEVEGQERANIFYCATIKTAEALPLIDSWAKRQIQ